MTSILCATPCGGDKGCTQMPDFRGRQPHDTRYAGGVCWLGSALDHRGAKVVAERNGWTVVGDADL